MKTYYLVSQDAHQVHVCRYEETENGGRIEYQPTGCPKPAADFDTWLNIDWLRDLRRRFFGKPDGSFVAYPFRDPESDDAERLEAALREAGFENAHAVADVDCVLPFYEAQLGNQERIADALQRMTVVMTPEQTRLVFSLPDYQRVHTFDTATEIGEMALTAFFDSLLENHSKLEICLIAGESPIQHRIIDEMKQRYPCPFLTGVGMDKAVHTGLELLAPKLSAACRAERLWFQNRDGADGLAGALYDQYYHVILAPLWELLRVSNAMDQSLSLWKAGVIRSRGLKEYTENLVRKNYERCPDEIRKCLQKFLREYRDTVNDQLKAMDFLFDKATSPLKITAPEEAPLWPTVFDYFGYRTEDALNRACNSLDMLRLPDHWWPADLVSGHRSRLFRTKQAQIEEVRGVCDRIAGENFKDAFGQREQDQNCLAFILAIFTDTQKQVSFAFTRLLNPRSIAYHRLKERMALVDQDAICAALDEIRQGRTAAGVGVRWARQQPEPKPEPCSGHYGDDDYTLIHPRI